jgi:hypothetical protein
VRLVDTEKGVKATQVLEEEIELLYFVALGE